MNRELRLNISQDVKKKKKNSLANHLLLETNLAPKLLLAPIVIFLLALTIFPTIYGLVISTQDYTLTDPSNRKFIGLENYLAMLKDIRFWGSIKNTAFFIVFALFFELIIGFMMAFLLAKNIFGVRVGRSLFLLPMITTPVVVALIWVMLLDPQFGVINYVFGLIGLEPQAWLASTKTALPVIIGVDIWQWTPFVTLILLSGLQSLPNEPYEAAKVDGASGFQTLIYITLPLMKKYIVIAMAFRFMDAFKWFDTIYVMTKGGPGTSTETINMYGYLMGFNFLNMGYAATLGIAMLFITIVVLQIFIKKTLSGGE